MTAAFLGTWENTSNENFDEFMKAVGMGSGAGSQPSTVKSTLEFTESGGKITSKAVGSRGTLEFTFELGKEFEHPLPHDPNLKVKNIVTLDGNKLVHKVKLGDKEMVTTSEVNGNELVSRHAVGPIVGVRKFKKIA